MRQVDRDELVYVMYSGLREWTISTRRRVFAPPHKRHEFDRSSACDKIVEKMRHMEVLDSGDCRHRLDQQQISKILQSAVDRFPGAIAALWLSGSRDREREAHETSANLLADALDAFEIMAETSISHFGQPVRFPAIIAVPHALLPEWP